MKNKYMSVFLRGKKLFWVCLREEGGGEEEKETETDRQRDRDRQETDRERHTHRQAGRRADRERQTHIKIDRENYNPYFALNWNLLYRYILFIQDKDQAA